MSPGRVLPYLFPNLEGRHRGQRINAFRKAWALACREATPELQEREGEVREKRRAELDTVVARARSRGS